ncbi:hypothetical protein ACFW9L_18505 [Streptomyces sp. NPDC059517]|uniref:hypothetical protein n=1 Tax=Streptomyces sp. NPDC059517 TaxID=3346855 RepID=UPI00369483D7
MLDGKPTLAEVGTAVMRIADGNSFAPEQEHEQEQEPCPADPPGAFLHGLPALPDLFAAGGFRVTDIATVFVEPGCCNGLRTWRQRRKVLDSTGRSNFSIKVPKIDASIRVPHTENPVRVRAPSSRTGVLQRRSEDSARVCPDREPQQYTSPAELLGRTPDPLGSGAATIARAPRSRWAWSQYSAAPRPWPPSPRITASTDNSLREQLGPTCNTSHASSPPAGLVDEAGVTLVGRAVGSTAVRGSRSGEVRRLRLSPRRCPSGPPPASGVGAAPR